MTISSTPDPLQILGSPAQAQIQIQLSVMVYPCFGIFSHSRPSPEYITARQPPLDSVGFSSFPSLRVWNTPSFYRLPFKDTALPRVKA